MTHRAAIAFGPFRLDLQAQCLWRERAAVSLRPKTWEVLRYLIDHPGRLVTKNELIAEVWAGTAVSDGTLTQSIRELRAALDDDSRQPKFIATVHRRGYRFIAPIESAPTEIGEPTAAPRLVGRDAESAQLLDTLAAVVRGQRRVVFVAGDAGIGKSALLDEFTRAAAAHYGDQIAIIRGQCVELRREAEPYLPVLDALQHWCADHDRARVVDGLRRFAPTWLVQMPWLLDREELDALNRQLVGTGSERMLRELAVAVDALACQRPLVVVLEDLHWCDLATVDLLATLAHRRAAAPLMLVGTLRGAAAGAKRHPVEDLMRTLTSRGDAIEIGLRVLSAAAARSYVEQRLDHTAPQPLVDAIYRHSGGHPLFMVTALGHALAQGWVVRDSDEWRLAIAASQLERAIPDGLRELIEAQAARLERDELTLLQAASVAGVEFSAQSLAVAVQQPVGEIEAALTRLSRRERFLRASAAGLPGRFEFAHALYQQVLYENAPSADRRRLHLQVARGLELEHGDRAAEIAAELAAHFERAGAYEEAVRYLGLAALNARARVADREAAALLEHALRLNAQVEDSPRRQRREADLWIQLGAVRGSIYGRGAEQYLPPFLRAWEIARSLDDVPRMFIARMAGFGHFGLTEQLRQAEEVCRDLITLAVRVPMPDLVAVADGAMGSVLLGMGRLEEARRYLEKALATLNPHDPSTQLFRRLEDPEILCLTSLAWALGQLGYPEQARQRCATATEIARARAPYHHVYCLNAAAILDLFLDEPDSCRRHAEATLGLAREHGFDGFLGNASLLAAWARERCQPAVGGWRRLQDELAAYRRCTQRFGLVPYQAVVAEACLKEGAYDDGLRVVAAAEALMASSGEHAAEGNLLRIKAQLLDGCQRDAAEVEQCFAAGLTAARAAGAKLAELRIANAFAGWLSQRGQSARAADLLTPVYNWFTEGFDLPDLKQARLLLQQLAVR